MAFQDWLTSDGHWMPIYPWLSSAGDKFVEHGHRLLGMLAGILSIALVAITWRTEQRSWVRKFSLVIFAGVVLQGVLGGMRILLDERTLALLHGCTGPLFFSLCVAMVVFTSKWWKEAGSVKPQTQIRPAMRLAVLCAALAYLQLVVGAVVRHSPHITSQIAATLFQVAVYFHILLAVLLVGHILFLAWRCVRQRNQAFGGLVLAALVATQVMLGLATWVIKYGVPQWAIAMVGEMPFVHREADLLQNAIITSHVAVGSLILVTSLAIALRLARLSGVSLSARVAGNSSVMEAAL